MFPYCLKLSMPKINRLLLQVALLSVTLHIHQYHHPACCSNTKLWLHLWILPLLYFPYSICHQIMLFSQYHEYPFLLGLFSLLPLWFIFKLWPTLTTQPSTLQTSHITTQSMHLYPKICCQILYFFCHSEHAIPTLKFLQWFLGSHTNYLPLMSSFPTQKV